jgi:hypothetical protein
MKKILLTCFIAVFFTTPIFAQNFRLTNLEGNNITNTSISIELDESQLSVDNVYDVYFKNLSSDSLRINVKRITENIVPGAQNLLCWKICHGPLVNQSTPIWVFSNDSIDNFKSHYHPFNTYGESNFTFIFFDVNNPTDSVFLRINYNTGTLNTNKIKSNLNGIKIFPNPSNLKFQIDFEPNKTNSQEVRISNILGSVVKSQKINKLESSVTLTTEDLEDGVYFVSVVSNGKIENTKRLVVKH